jgi:DNA polymerase III sliding clamp (beta) subunit (PCNA family)
MMPPSRSTLLRANAQREALLQKLELCSLIEPKHSGITNGTLVRAQGDSLTLIADNLVIRCRVELPAQIEREGAGILPAQRLAKLLACADGDSVTISATDEKTADVICGGISSTLNGWPASEFPQRIALPSEASFLIPNLQTAFAWISPAITDHSPHAGIHFFGDGKTLRIEALDGRQLHCATLESSAVVNVVAPPKIVDLIQECECSIETTERTISLLSGETFIQAQLFQGEFPDTSSVAPAPSDKVFTLPKSDLVRALKAAAAVFEKSIGPSAVNVSVKPAATTIRTDRCWPGLVETVIEVPNPFEVDFRIDPARLLNALKHVDTDDVVIQCDDPLRSVCIRDGDFLAVIALMRAP